MENRISFLSRELWRVLIQDHALLTSLNMPKKLFLPQSDYYYHVSARCINKEWFRIPIQNVWSIFSDYLFFINKNYNVEIYSFVLMDNHFHLMIRTPQANLDKAMNYFMRETSRHITFSCSRINQTFGGPYHWSLIKKPIYFLHAYKYVYRNPVEAGLVSQVEDYKYSTLHSKLGQSHSIIPVVEDTTLFSGVEATLAWLNKSYLDQDMRGDIRKALKRKTFTFGLNKLRQKNPLELQLV